MGVDLFDKTVVSTYDAIIKVGDNDTITSSAKRLSDGRGNDTAIWLSTTNMGVNAAPTAGYTLTVNGNILGTKIDATTFQILGGTGTQGTITWNTDENTADLIQNGTTLQVGQQVEVHVKNQTLATIPKGTPVYVTGTLGASGRLTVAPFIADGTIEAKFFLGVTAEDIINGSDGKVLTFGKIRGVDTSAYSEGQTLFVSATTAGAFQTTAPVSPDLDLEVAIVINSHVNNGTIFVRANNGLYLPMLHDVYINAPANGEFLLYNNSQSRWENTNTFTESIYTKAIYIDGASSLRTNFITQNGAGSDLDIFTIGGGDLSLITSDSASIILNTDNRINFQYQSSTKAWIDSTGFNFVGGSLTGLASLELLDESANTNSYLKAQVAYSQMYDVTTTAIYGADYVSTVGRGDSRFSSINRLVISPQESDTIGTPTKNLYIGGAYSQTSAEVLEEWDNVIINSTDVEIYSNTLVVGDLQVNTADLFVDGTLQNIGIGTSSPNAAAKLHVKDNDGAEIRIEDTTSTTFETLRFVGDASTYEKGIIAYNSGNLFDANSLHLFNSAGDIVFRTDNLGGTGTAKLRIDGATGYVGINTNSPDYHLDIEGAQRISNFSNARALILNSNRVIAEFNSNGAGTGDYSEIHIRNDVNASLRLGSIGSNYTDVEWANSSYIYDTGQDFLRIKASNQLELFSGGSALSNRRIVIDSTGKVGIGTDQPTDTLDVRGSLRSAPDAFDSSPNGTLFTHTLATAAGAGTKRVVNFDGNGGSPSVWWTNENNAIAAIDALNGTNGLTFWVNSSAGSWQRNFYIDTDYTEFERRVQFDDRVNISGNLGIGFTSAPSAKLQVYSSSENTRFDSADANGPYLSFRNSGVAKGYIGSAYHLWLSPNNSADNFAIRAENRLDLGVGTTPYLTINSSGQVGVNTQSNVFGEKLTVNGWIVAGDPSSRVGLFGQDGTNVVVGSYSNHPFVLRSNNTERVKLHTNGVTQITGVATTVNGTVQTLLVDGGTGNGALTINSASLYAYQTFAQGGTAKFEMGIVGTAGASYGDFYINKNIQQGESGASIYIKKSDGNVGIGTTSPSYKLDVAGQGRFGDYALIGTATTAGYYQDASNGAYRALANDGNRGYYFQSYGGGSTTMFIGLYGSYAGNVGIGTTSPSDKLHVVGNTKFDGNVVIDTNTGANALYITRLGATNQSMKIYTDDSACYFVADQDENTGQYGSIQMALDAGGTDNFFSVTDGVNGTARLFISNNDNGGYFNSGNFGIGTTSPSEKLDVVGTIRSTAYEGKIKINSTATNGKQYEFISIDTGNLGLYDGTAYRLWVGGSGNVGIGTTSPTNKLHVAGRVYVNHQEMHLDSPSYAMLNLDASGANYSYVSLQKDDATIWDIAQYNGGNLEFRPYGSGTNSIYFTHSGQGYFEQLELKGYSHKYLYINPGNGREAMVRYNGGSGTTWYVGKRTSSDVVGTESFHFYSQAAGQTVAGIDTAGNGRFRGDVVAYYSDMRLKTKLGDIENAIEKVQALNGFYYEPNKIAQSYGYEVERRIGLSAQDVKEVVPEAIHDAPVGDGYMSVDYAKLVPVLVEAIKEQQEQIEDLKAQVERLIATR